MTKIDKNIVRVLLSLAFVLMIIGFILSVEATFMVIGFFLALGYFIFMGLHLMLCYPSILIGLEVSDFIDVSFNSIKEKSIILAHLFRVPIVLLSIVMVHVIWLYLSVSLLTYNFTIINFFETLNTL